MPPFNEGPNEWADSILNSMSLQEKIGQLIMVPGYSNKGENHVKYIEKLIKKHHVGGIIFFQGGPLRQIKQLNKYQEVTKIPLLVAMDAEWGLSMRLDSTIRYPYQMTLGAIQNNHLIYRMGEDIAAQMNRLGVHMNFAPVADVNVNPDNPVINYRSFGEEKIRVSEKSLAYVQGLQDNCILATIKHFPGHGDTRFDSHKTLPVINHSKERLENIELYPFQFLIKKGAASVMTAHLSVPALDSTKLLPTSLSKPVIQGILKNEMGFEGITVTDALNMKGVSNYYNAEDIAIHSIKAGNDVLLMPEDVEKTIEAIQKAIKKGSISKQDINAKCKKILYAKYWLGLYHKDSIISNNLYSDLHLREYEHLRNKLYEASLTVIQNKNDLIPLKSLDTLSIASVTIGDGSINRFQKKMDFYTRIKHFSISKYATLSEFNELRQTLNEFDLVIIGIHKTSLYPSKGYGITKHAVDFATRLAEQVHVILDLFANPYGLAYFSNTDVFESIIISYEDEQVVHELSAQLIFGGIGANGILPVTATPDFPAGTGLIIPKTRLKYSVPEEVNINTDTLHYIDSIVFDAIKKKAIPGCQVLIAKDEVVFYNKTFGYHTYLNETPVKHFDLYDVASLTKIMATVPALMKLYEDEKLYLDEKLSTYLPFLDTTNKKDIRINEVLSHQAGLFPWLPFYLYTIEGLDYKENLFNSELTIDYPFMLDHNKFLNKNYRFKKGVFSYDYSETFHIKVADHLYMNASYIDTIYKRINKSKLLEEKKYCYSDLGFYYFYKLIERLTGRQLEQYIQEYLYNPIGANYTMYLPLRKYPPQQIVPTENDQIFRKQLLRGYVHDPGAAMLGGVGGHAGVFSNANDLAKIMQMYLNGGCYGGDTFFSDSTVDEFTFSPFKDNDNRRALGFDKPVTEMDKPGPTCKGIYFDSFGHTGFTGTIAWADPEYNIIYIFLSNRIHPDQYNRKLITMDVRTKIQKIIYDALDHKECKGLEQ
jgi:beta-glucosidase-like glycosyl hydrolase/CubicO group peptidase (beta-lactamase class C family)